MAKIPIRVAVIGAGAISTEFANKHFGTVTGTSVVGVVDCNEAAANSLASDVGCPWFTKLSDALEVTKPDMVYIGTPPSTHRALTEAVLAADTHVLLEKPLAASAVDGDAIVAAAEAAESRGVLLGLNIGMRWNRAQIRMRQLAFEERVVGNLKSGLLEMHYKQWPRQWQTVPWCAGREQGGPLREVGSHFLFGIQEIFGSSQCVKRVRATVTWPGDDPQGCEKSAEGELELNSGLVLGLRLTTDGSAIKETITRERYAGDRYELRLVGEGGKSLLLEDFTSLRIEQIGGEGGGSTDDGGRSPQTVVESAPYGRRESVESVASAVRKICGESVADGFSIPARITAREARDTQAVLDAILSSNGEWIAPQYLAA